MYKKLKNQCYSSIFVFYVQTFILSKLSFCPNFSSCPFNNFVHFDHFFWVRFVHFVQLDVLSIFFCPMMSNLWILSFLIFNILSNFVQLCEIQVFNHFFFSLFSLFVHFSSIFLVDHFFILSNFVQFVNFVHLNFPHFVQFCPICPIQPFQYIFVHFVQSFQLLNLVSRKPRVM